jgi:hypothetical protein
MVGERDMLALRGDDALLTTLASWSVMNLSAKSRQLSSKVDSVAFSIVYIVLVMNEEDHGWTPTMGMDKANSSHQREVSDSRLPNTSEVSLMEVHGREDTGVRTRHASIYPSIHERADIRGCAVVGEVIHRTMQTISEYLLDCRPATFTGGLRFKKSCKRASVPVLRVLRTQATMTDELSSCQSWRVRNRQ